MSDMDPGQWQVGEHSDYPGYVQLMVNHISEEGVEAFTVYFTPEDARNLSSAMNLVAGWIDE